MNWNKQTNFLDTLVYKTPRGKLNTKLFAKDTDQQAYLRLKSEHPESLKRNITFLQTLRLYVQLIKSFN